ncbi:MAG TPA: RNA-directed DNA polymerase [Bacteroidetes bacterium]|nr:RNA-directed DNA polymerase [Bacteroidota bacterium]
MRKLYRDEVKNRACQFLECQNMIDLHRLGFDTARIKLLALAPPYYCFDMPKESGGVRHIEAPEEHLKDVQRQFNRYLQCVYFEIQTPPSYGYIIRTKGQTPWKNVLENARQHLGARYMLNVDFKDFFHQFTLRRIHRMLQCPPFQFDNKTAHLLARLFCYKGRLPMGAPTSPALSNIGTIAFDNDMYAWASNQKLTFTRFVDDMTFSSPIVPLTDEHLAHINTICQKHALLINPDKTVFFGEADTKKVTKLLLRDTVDIDPDFYRELDKDIIRLKHLTEVNILMENHKRGQLLRKFKKEVEGQVNFIGMIEGFDSSIFYKYRMKMKEALKPDNKALSSRWTNFNYF